MVQGAIMAIEDGWVLAEHVAAQQPVRTDAGSGVDWDAALAAYDAVRPPHYPVFPLPSMPGGLEVEEPPVG